MGLFDDLLANYNNSGGLDGLLSGIYKQQPDVMPDGTGAFMLPQQSMSPWSLSPQVMGNVPSPDAFANPSIWGPNGVTAPQQGGLPIAGSSVFPQSAMPPPMAPQLPPPQTIGYAPGAAPQDDASLPPNAQPTVGQAPQAMQPPAPQAVQQPQLPAFLQPQQDNGPGDKFLTGLQSFLGGGGLISAMRGAANGQRTDPQGMQQQQARATYQALVASGVPQSHAMAAALNPDILKTIAPAYFDTKPELKETATDPLTGEKKFSVYDSARRTLTPVGQPNAANPSGGGLGALNQAIQAGVRGEELYKHLPPALAPTVKAMIEGRQPIPSTQGMRSPAILAMIDAAHAIDPTFDATSWQQRVAGQKDFAGGGKEAAVALRRVGER